MRKEISIDYNIIPKPIVATVWVLIRQMDSTSHHRIHHVCYFYGNIGMKIPERTMCQQEWDWRGTDETVPTCVKYHSSTWFSG